MEWNYNDLMDWDDTKDNIPNVIKIDIRLNNLKILPLNASCNPKIKNINHLTKLRILSAGGNCGITNEDITMLTNLKELYYCVVL